MGHHSCCNQQKVKRGLWSPEEDEKLIRYISTHGYGCWSEVPEKAGLQRCGKSCRLRWINYLRPDIRRGRFTPDEEKLIISLHEAVGNRWAHIASHLPGRTDNEIKNYWNSWIKKKITKKQRSSNSSTAAASSQPGVNPTANNMINSHDLPPAIKSTCTKNNNTPNNYPLVFFANYNINNQQEQYHNHHPPSPAPAPAPDLLHNNNDNNNNNQVNSPNPSPDSINATKSSVNLVSSSNTYSGPLFMFDDDDAGGDIPLISPMISTNAVQVQAAEINSTTNNNVMFTRQENYVNNNNNNFIIENVDDCCSTSWDLNQQHEQRRQFQSLIFQGGGAGAAAAANNSSAAMTTSFGAITTHNNNNGDTILLAAASSNSSHNHDHNYMNNSSLPPLIDQASTGSLVQVPMEDQMVDVVAQHCNSADNLESWLVQQESAHQVLAEARHLLFPAITYFPAALWGELDGSHSHLTFGTVSGEGGGRQMGPPSHTTTTTTNNNLLPPPYDHNSSSL